MESSTFLQVAKTTLIKSIANAILSYIVSLFLFSKNFCYDINSMLRKFWWGFPQDKKHNLSLLSPCKTMMETDFQGASLVG
jgi:hypothetical protein